MQTADWKKIIDEHRQSVWQSAYRLLGNYADASDCFQETFISAFEICRRQNIRNFAALLARLVTARAIDQLRLRFRNEKYKNSAGMITVPQANSQPLEHLQQREMAFRLREALSKLPRQEAEVFCLRYLNDMSYQQIADQMGITINAAGVILHRAKSKLQKLFEVSQKEQNIEVIK
jgi:RNA polymerase sigma-70 factor, ECF subfamily